MALIVRVNLAPVVEELGKIAAEQKEQTVTFKAILANLTDEPGGDGDLQARIDALTKTLKESNDRLAAAGQPPVPVPGQPVAARSTALRSS